MIVKFLKRWDERQHLVRAQFTANAPESYKEIVEAVLTALAGEEEYNWPDPSKLTELSHGGYPGTLLYIVPGNNYSPDTYYAVSVDYGSCSGCDTLQAIGGYFKETPTPEQVDQYMQLAFDVLRGFKQISGYSYDETAEEATEKQRAAETPAISPLAAVATVTLPLTPVELGVVVALAGLGLSAMTGNRASAEDYQRILANPDVAPVAHQAFAALVSALETQGGEQ
jgi:hypothetical protein